jgi:DNA-directed RNA polymerase subunit RPC12/RpoP
MTKTLKAKFINGMERQCPYCGATDPELIEHEDLEDGTWAFSYRCQACGEDFDEIYTKIWVYDTYFGHPNKAIKVLDPTY